MLSQDDLKAITTIVQNSEKKIIKRMIKSQNIIIAEVEDERVRIRQRLEKIEDKVGIIAIN